MKKFLGKAKGWIPKTKRQRFITVVAFVFLVLAAVPLLGRMLASTSQQPATDQRDAVLTHSTDRPDETPPGSNYRWYGWPEDPKKIIVPSLNIDGFIQKVGIDQNQQVTVPNNIHLAGWFVDSVRPGSNGLAIIDGHVDGRTTAAGIFGRLGELKKDDTFQIERGDGKILSYKVLDTVETPLEEAASVLFSQHPRVTSQLNLITCSGTYDRSAKTYSNRTIVSAELIVEVEEG